MAAQPRKRGVGPEIGDTGPTAWSRYESPAPQWLPPVDLGLPDDACRELGRRRRPPLLLSRAGQQLELGPGVMQGRRSGPNCLLDRGWHHRGVTLGTRTTSSRQASWVPPPAPARGRAVALLTLVRRRIAPTTPSAARSGGPGRRVVGVPVPDDQRRRCDDHPRGRGPALAGGVVRPGFGGLLPVPRLGDRRGLLHARRGRLDPARAEPHRRAPHAAAGLASGLSYDRRVADLQDVFFNEPWFFVEGRAVGGAHPLVGTTAAAPAPGRSRRPPASRSSLATGILSGLGVIGSFIVET